MSRLVWNKKIEIIINVDVIRLTRLIILTYIETRD